MADIVGVGGARYGDAGFATLPPLGQKKRVRLPIRFAGFVSLLVSTGIR